MQPVTEYHADMSGCRRNLYSIPVHRAASCCVHVAGKAQVEHLATPGLVRWLVTTTAYQPELKMLLLKNSHLNKIKRDVTTLDHIFSVRVYLKT